MGDGFKFDDYYSAYGLKHEYKNMNEEKIESLDEIKQNYKITDQMVEEKKKIMLDAFPYASIK